MGKPLPHGAFVLFPILGVLDEQPQQFYGIRQVVLVVVFSYPEQNWSNEIAVRRSELHHELATEQLPNKWFVDDIGCEELLDPVRGGSQTLHILPHALASVCWIWRSVFAWRM